MALKTLLLDVWNVVQEPMTNAVVNISYDRTVRRTSGGMTPALSVMTVKLSERDTVSVLAADDPDLTPDSAGFVHHVRISWDDPADPGRRKTATYTAQVLMSSPDPMPLSQALVASGAVPPGQIIAPTVSWNGDRLTVNGVTGPSLAADASSAEAAAAASAADAAASAALVGAPAGSAIDAHLGGDSTNLVAAVAGKVVKDSITVLAADHGVVGDGFTDDGPALAAAIAAAGVGGTVQLPKSGNVRVTSPVQITTSGLTIRSGSQWQSRIFADGCNGIEVAAGVTGLTLQGIEVACKVRYTTTANALYGIKFNGTSSSQCSNNVLRDVYVDGFQTAFYGNYLWNTVFDHFSCNYGLLGIDVYGKSVNNFVTGGSSCVTTLVAGSRCIRLVGNDGSLTGSAVGSEGWVIGDTLTADAEVGIELIGVANTSIHDCIIDFNSSKGVRIADNGTNFGGNVRVAGCYIALTGTAGVAAIESANTVSNTQNTRNRFSDNELVVYSGSTGTYGISTPTANGQFIARGNTISNFATNDIFMASGGNIVEANACLSTGQANSNIYTNGTLINTVANNIGTVYSSFHRITQTKLGGMSVLSCDQAPASGTWTVGAYCRNSAPAAGSPKGWFCTVAGTPGTWVSEGNL